MALEHPLVHCCDHPVYDVTRYQAPRLHSRLRMATGNPPLCIPMCRPTVLTLLYEYFTGLYIGPWQQTPPCALPFVVYGLHQYRPLPDGIAYARPMVIFLSKPTGVYGNRTPPLSITVVLYQQLGQA